jgi:hypothetical protein
MVHLQFLVYRMLTRHLDHQLQHIVPQLQVVLLHSIELTVGEIIKNYINCSIMGNNHIRMHIIPDYFRNHDNEMSP